MKRLLIILVLAFAATAVLAWGRSRGAADREVRNLIDEVQSAALAGLNDRDPDALNEYFATEAEGAQVAGLAETLQAYRAFATQLPDKATVQFHSLEVTAVEVHEEANLARVTYRLHFSVIRGGLAIFSAKAIQNLALLETARGWRISGGDAVQLEDVAGNWPPS